MVSLILVMVLGGLIIGALGRLVVPGPNPMSILRTIAVGLAGSFLGGLVGRLVIGMRYRYSGVVSLVVAVIFTALIVYFLDSRRHSHRPNRPAGHRW